MNAVLWICAKTSPYVTWLIHTWHGSFLPDMSCLFVIWHDSFMSDRAHSFEARLIHVWHNVFMLETTHSRMHVATINLSAVDETTESGAIFIWHDASTRNMTHPYFTDSFSRDMTHPWVTWFIHVWRDSFIRDMTHSYVTQRILKYMYRHKTCRLWRYHNWIQCHSYLTWRILRPTHTCDSSRITNTHREAHRKPTATGRRFLAQFTIWTQSRTSCAKTLHEGGEDSTLNPQP